MLQVNKMVNSMNGSAHVLNHSYYSPLYKLFSCNTMSFLGYRAA